MLPLEDCEGNPNCASRTAAEIFADHTTYSFNSEPLPPNTLKQLYNLIKNAPTSMNTHPMRLVEVPAHKKPEFLGYMSEKNRDRTATAPLTVIVAVDTNFHETLQLAYPGFDSLHSMFEGNTDEERFAWAEKQTWIQLGYLIVAARGLGYGVGPMTGFNRAKVDEDLLPPHLRSIAVVNIGKPGENPYRPRKPRLTANQVITTL